MIRVFSKDCDNKTENIEGIINMPVLFWIFFPLISAEKQKVIHKYGHVPIDKEKIKIPIFRIGFPNLKTNKVKVWCFWDGEKEWAVENITQEQRKLPMKIIVNDTALIEKIENGWSPENDAW
ncbi:hypothetical protein HNW77_04540 [Komagataeibacter sp. AV436]|uniref:Uncharacterized protein n=2 Tax=Acetobacteraceae TaxID=433 RepID=A0ABX2ABF2_9PROT|nr:MULTISPECIES: hypothetical protein [Komagataeibacter]MBV1830232.1 hypothetical protein [Komagataeibacter melomenusus]MCK9821191.1 hypothetical protein [Komagataeibacter oboediens]NPC65678.1 hypothetical protein [Komagataeibacter melomenusus]